MNQRISGSKSVDEYIAAFPEPVQQILEKIRETIKELAPAAIEKIAYGIPTFWLNENLVHFAAFKSHIGFYPTPSGIEAFKDELSTFKTSKGAVQFPIDKPIPLSLIKKIVKYRVATTNKNVGKRGL
ncbi:MAG: DUF1801 domain-containing protein [Deltaproteobacteria bacterium]|nr:DUF1801 domain-containing protein [Deltaproteobacteria bacterium]